MNNFVTVYELLGLIKDGKAPKKIKYNNRTYEFKEIIEGTGYVYESGTVKFWLSNEIEFDISRCLNEKIEILEEDKPIIEKLDTTSENTLFTMECFTGIPEKAQDWNFNVLKDKLNEVIDYINKIIELDGKND